MQYPYIPNSNEAVRKEMLDFIGAKSVEEIYSFIPDEVRMKKPLDIPAPFTTEQELSKHMNSILAEDSTCEENISFLGAGCYQHYVPAICDEINGKGEFLTAYGGESYNDFGRFQSLFEYESMMAELLDMEVVNVPTMDYSQAAATAIRMGSRVAGRTGVLVPASMDREKLAVVKNYCTPDLQIEEVKCDDKTGCIRIYREPEPGVPYVIGGDTAGAGSDSFVAQVLDNRTGVQVAQLRGKFDEDVFARQVYCLGLHYNTALIGLETNFSTYPVMELERLRYPHQYVRETIDDYTHKVRQSFGFLTNTKTRPVILAELIKAVRDDIEIVNDETTLEEMLSFVRNPETLKPEAEPGAHDDCVLSLAIAHHIRPQQSYLLQEPRAQGVKWSRSQWEDYENASPAEREMLKKKWGTPAT